MGGGYTVAGSTLTVSPMASTMMACADQTLMALDQAVGSRLEGTLKIEQLDAATLKLSTAAGDVLTLRGEPTSKPATAARVQPCSGSRCADQAVLAPADPRQAMLARVREVHYDDKGLEQGQRGAFENFYDGIEGYTHEAGVRNVLRVKRYAVKNPPADASSQAYVLDMVVGSKSWLITHPHRQRACRCWRTFPTASSLRHSPMTALRPFLDKHPASASASTSTRPALSSAKWSWAMTCRSGRAR